MAKVYTEDTGKDLVVASDPPGETLVEQGTVVNLLVSLGPRPRSYLLPDLSGRDLDDVARSLREEGFPVQIREGGPKQKAGLISAQEPTPGHRVSPRDSIVLYQHP
jgi:serine/threonine-protein kinase